MFKLIYTGPSDFRVLLSQLIIAGVVILSAFTLGSRFYEYGVLNKYPPIKVRSFMANLTYATQRDLEIDIDGKKTLLKKEDVKKWVEYYVRSYSKEKDLRISPDKLRNYLGSIAENTNIEPTDAKFEFEGNKAKVFVPSTRGKRLNFQKSGTAIVRALISNLASAQLEVENIEPEVTLEKINTLGITTLLGRGESNFSGSHGTRINNIKIGATKFNGVIIKPGEEFSFNNLLGAVDEKGGYEYELVIKNGKTIPEYGGGLCQVSTTMFRAAVLAGLPITERKPHSFPVPYYNPQGFDATIYPGGSDLKFTNDTKRHLLIQTKVDTAKNKLTIEIYGSNNGRRIEVDGPHQYDQKPDGSMKAYLVRTITNPDGTRKEDRFMSNYKSPALYPLEKNPLE